MIGKPANIYQTACEGGTAFVILLGDKKGNIPKSEVTQLNTKVGQLAREVGQPSHKKDLEAYLYALESELKDQKSLILKNARASDAYKENQRPRARFEPASWPLQLRI